MPKLNWFWSIHIYYILTTYVAIMTYFTICKGNVLLKHNILLKYFPRHSIKLNEIINVKSLYSKRTSEYSAKLFLHSSIDNLYAYKFHQMIFNFCRLFGILSVPLIRGNGNYGRSSWVLMVLAFWYMVFVGIWYLDGKLLHTWTNNMAKLIWFLKGKAHLPSQHVGHITLTLF